MKAIFTTQTYTIFETSTGFYFRKFHQAGSVNASGYVAGYFDNQGTYHPAPGGTPQTPNQ